MICWPSERPPWSLYPIRRMLRAYDGTGRSRLAAMDVLPNVTGCCSFNQIAAFPGRQGRPERLAGSATVCGYDLPWTWNGARAPWKVPELSGPTALPIHSGSLTMRPHEGSAADFLCWRMLAHVLCRRTGSHFAGTCAGRAETRQR